MKFHNYLENRIKTDLPGITAHEKMAPIWNGKPFRSFQPTETARKSAVMIIMEEIENDYQIYLTLRSSNLNSHKGQISFPGGRADEGETVIETALRETYEEIGINKNELQIIGELSTLFVPPSNSIISPVVSLVHSKPNISINPDEVEEYFTSQFSYFTNEANIITENWTLNGKDVVVPLWHLHPKTPLWGATAIILSELIELHREYIEAIG